ncbi:MAG: YdeI/OmpD-associated family protein [Chitinophagaceae bacterium]
MITFKATILQFEQQGEKTGWRYIQIPEKIVQQLKPGNKKSFRVKGKLDNYAISGVALIPMGAGTFILPVNAAMRKGTGKTKGATLAVQLQADEKLYQLNKAFLACLEDEPAALAFLQSMPLSWQHYFSKWIESARTEATLTKRIAQSVSALAKKMNYGEMIRALKKDKDDLAG